MPRQWPLLADFQDPDSLEARLAFHLHRLHLTGSKLKQSGFTKPHKAHLLSQGRLPLMPRDVDELAAKLGVTVIDLTRPLTPIEQDEWAFYRQSAADRLGVWERAQQAWLEAGLNTTAAAAVMDISLPKVSSALRPEGTRILAYDEAARLVTALGLHGGPWRLIGSRNPLIGHASDALRHSTC